MCHAVLAAEVEVHQGGQAFIFLVVEFVVLVLILFLVVRVAFRIVRVVRLYERLERLAVFAHQAGNSQIAGDLHNRRVDLVLVVSVILV